MAVTQESANTLHDLVDLIDDEEVSAIFKTDSGEWVAIKAAE